MPKLSIQPLARTVESVTVTGYLPPGQRVTLLDKLMRNNAAVSNDECH